MIGFDLNLRAVHLDGRILRARSVDAGKGLRAQRSRRRIGEAHAGHGVIDGHLPVVAGHVPVKLVVAFNVLVFIIIIAVEKARAVAYAVVNLDGPCCIHRVGDINLQIAGAVRSRRVIFEFAAVAVGPALRPRGLSLFPDFLDDLRANQAIQARPRRNQRRVYALVAQLRLAIGRANGNRRA